MPSPCAKDAAGEACAHWLRRFTHEDDDPAWSFCRMSGSIHDALGTQTGRPSAYLERQTMENVSGHLTFHVVMRIGGKAVRGMFQAKSKDENMYSGRGQRSTT